MPTHCHDHISDDNNDDFILKLGLASPFSHFFLPGHAMRERVTWIEDNILPAGFANQLWSAIAADPFVEYANQGENKSLERFLEGIADTGRRGTKEALRVLFSLLDEPEPEEIAEFCVRLTVASETLLSPNLESQKVLEKLNALETTEHALAQSLTDFCQGGTPQRATFTAWAERHFPMLSSPLSTFVHNLLFHDFAYPEAHIPYAFPKLNQSSDILTAQDYSPLVSLSLATPQCQGKVSYICVRFVFVAIPKTHSNVLLLSLRIVGMLVLFCFRRTIVQSYGVELAWILGSYCGPHQDSSFDYFYRVGHTRSVYGFTVEASERLLWWRGLFPLSMFSDTQDTSTGG